MVVLSLALCLAAAPVMDSPALTPAEQQSFKAWFEKGEGLFKEGEYGAAIYAFEQAELIKKTPEVAFDLAKAHQKLGDSAFAIFYYRLYMRRAPTAGDALEVAEIVGDALAKAEQEGRGLLEIDGYEPATITVNGISYPDFPVAVFLPPGDYEVTAAFANGASRRNASIVSGKVTPIQLDRTPPPLLAISNQPVNSSWAAPAGESADSSVSTKAPLPLRPTLHTASYVLMGVGAAAIVVGGLFGAMSNADRSRLSTDKANLTVSEGRTIASNASTKASTANVFFVIGGASAIAGGVMFGFTLPEPGRSSADTGGAAP